MKSSVETSGWRRGLFLCTYEYALVNQAAAALLWWAHIKASVPQLTVALRQQRVRPWQRVARASAPAAARARVADGPTSS